MGRLYVVKSRLQQACDAGVLAGRKFMVADGSSTLDANATRRAQDFFKNNFPAGWVNTTNLTFTPTKTGDQQVSGTASVTVPMTVTKIMKAGDATVNVTCKARYDIADTDIIFVLDTTGSMACRPEDSEAQCNSYVNANPAVAYTRPSNDPDAMPGYLGTTGYGVPETLMGTGSRMKALRQAVKDFYDTVATSVDSSTRIRYGFVSYTSIVNAGKAISSVSPSYLVGSNNGEKVDYETRQVADEYQISLTSTPQANTKTQAGCSSSASTPTRSPATALTFRTSDSSATYTWQEWNATIGRCSDYVRTVGPMWLYKQYPIDVSKYVTGAPVVDPTQVNGATSRWDGCIEERQTQAGVTSFNSTSYDLDPSLVPSSNVATRWRPAWAAASWARYRFYSTTDQKSNGEDFSPYYPFTNSFAALNMAAEAQRKSGFYSCGKPIHRLSAMSASDVAAYVDAADFKPLGGTYHDTGMIWGVRLLAPSGIFAADNSGRSGQPAPKKVIVFLTDGDMAPNANIYGQYGMEYYDQRVAGTNTSTSLKDFHNARFLYECSQASNLKIDVWTVAIAPNTTDQLTQCASNSGQALYTTTGSGLSTLFQKIAKQVAMLRLDK